MGMSIWSDSKLREPHWYGVLSRVLLVTVVCTLLVFAVSLLVGIVGTVIDPALSASQSSGVNFAGQLIVI